MSGKGHRSERCTELFLGVFGEEGYGDVLWYTRSHSSETVDVGVNLTSVVDAAVTLPEQNPSISRLDTKEMKHHVHMGTSHDGAD